MDHVVIIGNGVSGITAARHIRKRSNSAITVISAETPYFFSRTALMYVYMGHMKFEHIKPYEDWFWKKNDISLVHDRVANIDITRKLLHLEAGTEITYDKLIIASGSVSNALGVPGENLQGVQCLYSYQDLQRMEDATRNITHAVVVGGGLIGVELAEMLHSRNIHTTLLVREAAFWNNVLPIQEAQMISRHIAGHGVTLKHNTTVTAIRAGNSGKVAGVRTSDGEDIPCDFVGIAVGVQPNVAWLGHSGIATNRGVLVNAYLETNVPDVYAIGDCVERTLALEGRKNIEQVWYTARMMGEVVAQTVCGERTPYEPGPWFNSAKFFDIEFQSYGNVAASLADHQDELYWEHPSGRKAVHMVWEKDTRCFSGINTFGIRMRHESFDRWLRAKETIDHVMEHLSEANFDPEFTPRHEKEIQQEKIIGNWQGTIGKGPNRNT